MADTNVTAPNPSRRSSWLRWVLLAWLLATFWTWQSSRRASEHPEIDYSTVYTWIDQRKVASVVMKGRSLEGRLVAPQTVDKQVVASFHTLVPPNDDSLVALMRARSIRIRVASEQAPLAIQLVTALLPWALIIGAWLWISRRAQRLMIAGGGGLGGFLKRGKRFEKLTAVGVTFADVAGASSAKRDLEEVVRFLKEPEQFRKLGGRVPRGVLLVGPPGTGKTLLARAVAGEASVPFFSITGSEFIELFVGVGAARVRDLFEEAKQNAPSIVFIDELDAVGRVRGAGYGGGHDEREQTLNQLLSEMDGFDRNDLVVVLSATNRPDVLDPALLRPGRFDRRIVVDLPELAARHDILAVHVQHKPIAADVDLDELARATPGFSGADLANLVNEAALHATRRRADAIDRADFGAAYDKIVLGDPREGRLSVEEKRRIAVHEAGHALLAWVTPGAEPLRRCTILPRGLALGATQQLAPEERHIMTRTELQARLAVLLGGYAAERVVLGDISTGAEDDLRKATTLASKMVAHYGMSEQLGPVYYEYQEEHAFLGHRIATEAGTSDATVDTIEREARDLLARALSNAVAMIEAHRGGHDRVRAALLERETLERDALEQLLGPAGAPPSAAITTSVTSAVP